MSDKFQGIVEGKMDKTKIDWCDSTWNPVTGCWHGCEYCYARGIAKRFGRNLPDLSDFASKNKGLHLLDNKIDSTPYPFGFEPTFHAYRLNEYIGKQGRNKFVCSMADLFGKWVPDRWIEEVFKACEKAPQHNYLFLTKNPQRYEQYGVPSWQNNMWYGCTISRKADIRNSAFLPLECKRFVSIEPLLEDIQPKDDALYNYVYWAIIGAETGRRKDKVVPKRKWIEDIVNECRKSNVPVFMKSSLAEIWGEPLIQEFPVGLRDRLK